MSEERTEILLTKAEYMRKVERYYDGSDDWMYKAIDAYERVDDVQQWELCPYCALFPKTWKFNNGNLTACGCGKDQYDHRSIHSESIMSYVTRSHNGKSALGYDNDALRKNWNHWCKTGEELFVHAGKRTDGRW